MCNLSVVITTYNRRDTLDENLTRLAAQNVNLDTIEVIVIDDGSNDGTREMVHAKAVDSPFSLRYLYHANRGPGYSQNRGIREAKYPLILLLADDALPMPGLLYEHLRLHNLHPQSNVAVAGKMQQSPELPDTLFLRYWDPWENRYLDSCDELEYIFFWGCNVSFKRSLILDHGFFLERQGAAMEDVELGFHLARTAEMKLLYGKKAICHHKHYETIDSACKRAYERGLNFDILTNNVTDPLLFARLRILGQPVFRPSSLESESCNTLFGHEQAIKWERWRLNPWRRAVFHLLFNAPMVHLLWLPLMRVAHTHRLFEFLVGPRVIYCTVVYFLNSGINDMAKYKQQGCLRSQSI
jgi:glycosyltransferase involved in cell wall biosynthesis